MAENRYAVSGKLCRPPQCHDEIRKEVGMSSMKYVATGALALTLAVGLSGCAGVIRPVRDAISPPGEMNSDGSINPCHGYKADAQACGNAAYNGARIGGVKIGQSLPEVRTILGRDPEERSVRTEAGQSFETWSYRTDYKNRITIRIDFLDSKVVGIRQDRS